MKSEKVQYEYPGNILMDPAMPAYNNIAVVKKRAEEMKDLLKKHPLPGTPKKANAY